MSKVRVNVYPVNSWESCLVYLVGRWTRRIDINYVHWSISLCVDDETWQEYHLTGKGVQLYTDAPTPPFRVWEFNISPEYMEQIINRIGEVIHQRSITSLQSMLRSYVKPCELKVDTCLAFTVYSLIGYPSPMYNYPMLFITYLGRVEDSQYDEGLREGAR